MEIEVLVIQIDAFRPAAEVKADVDRILAHIKASPKVSGRHRIYVAGEKEFECHQDRQTNGIPLHPSVVDDMKHLAQDLGIPAPKPYESWHSRSDSNQSWAELSQE